MHYDDLCNAFVYNYESKEVECESCVPYITNNGPLRIPHYIDLDPSLGCFENLLYIDQGQGQEENEYFLYNQGAGSDRINTVFNGFAVIPASCIVVRRKRNNMNLGL